MSDKDKTENAPTSENPPKKENNQKTPTKEIKNISELPEKQAAYHLLRENGLSILDAGKALDYTKNTAYTVNSKLNKYKFTGNHKAQKVAYNTIQALSAGQIPKKSVIKEVKDSTALNAAQYVSNHNDPVIQHVKTRNESIIAVVELDKYK